MLRARRVRSHHPMTPSGAQIELASGDQRVVVVEVGGGLRSYTAGGADVLDGYAADAMCSAGRGPALAPWPNRLEDGSYELDGRRHQVPLSEVPNRNAIHGLVRWSSFTATERAATASLWRTCSVRSRATRSRSTCGSPTRSAPMA